MGLASFMMQTIEPSFYHINVDRDGGGETYTWSPEASTILDGNSFAFTNDDIGEGWTAEHLFTASIVNRVVETLFRLAGQEGLSFDGFSLKSTGKAEVDHGRVKIKEVIIVPCIEIVSEAEKEILDKIFERIVGTLLIAKSKTTRIKVRPIVEVLSMVE